MNPRRWINSNSGPVTLLAVVILATSLLIIRKETRPRQYTPATPARPIVHRPNPYGLRPPPARPFEDPFLTAKTTIDQRHPSPERAIVFGLPIRWWCSHWAGRTPGCVAVKHSEDSVRFVVGEPNHRRVWVKYLDIPIDANQYPILVMKYRARNTDSDATEYALYLDDGCGPDYGGLIPFAHRDIVADGDSHVLTCDLHSMKPLEHIIGLAVGVRSSATIPAAFELMDLRFEAPQEPTTKTASDASLTVYVSDASGHPLQDATVTVDAERRNWARTAATGADGNASLIPCRTGTGEHTIRVNRPGMLPSETHVPAVLDTPLTVTLVPASVYFGQVCDESGRPLSQASVWLYVASSDSQMHHAQIMTDHTGHWTSPPLPAQADRVEIGLVHPDYPDKRGFSALYARFPYTGDADLGALPIRQATADLHGTVYSPQGSPVSGANVRACWTQNDAVTGPEGAFSIQVAHAGEPLIFEHEDYATKAILHASPSSNDVLAIALEGAHAISGHIFDPDEQPVKGLRVHACLPGLMRVNYWECVTDRDGSFQWPHAPSHPITLCFCSLGVRQIMMPRPEPYRMAAPSTARQHGDPRPSHYDPRAIFLSRS